jgi:hypothetical protein
LAAIHYEKRRNATLKTRGSYAYFGTEQKQNIKNYGTVLPGKPGLNLVGLKMRMQIFEHFNLTKGKKGRNHCLETELSDS